jgi:hypothetical protein
MIISRSSPPVGALLLLLLLASCQRLSDASAAATEVPATAVVPLASGLPLDQMLDMLQRELDAAVSGELDDDDVNARLIRAEAITDRLLDSRIPFEWLSAEHYRLDARLRQIQALADRVIAQIRSRAARTAMLTDARVLRDDVVRLRGEIGKGGGAAPRPLSELLAGADSGRRRPVPTNQP